PLFSRDGGFIAPGYAPELDELRLLRDESRRLIANLQARYVADTGIGSLKIRHNNVLGYFVEVPAGQAGRMAAGPDSVFIHRQTLASAVRYTSVELSELETKIAQAGDKALAIELALFESLAGDAVALTEPIRAAAQALALLDVAAGHADLAVEKNYV